MTNCNKGLLQFDGIDKLVDKLQQAGKIESQQVCGAFGRVYRDSLFSSCASKEKGPGNCLCQSHTAVVQVSQKNGNRSLERYSAFII